MEAGQPIKRSECAETPERVHEDVDVPLVATVEEVLEVPRHDGLGLGSSRLSRPTGPESELEARSHLG